MENNIESSVRDTVCGFRNLYNAMHKCSRNVKWKDSVYGYLDNGLVNIYKLRKSLYDGTYKISKYTQFKVYEPKERDIVSTRFNDRVFQRSLCDNYLYHEVTKHFIYDNVACQEDKGTTLGLNRLTCQMQRFWRKHGMDGWIYKFDLKDYFGSTPHSVAFESVSSRIDDDWVESEVLRLVKSFNQGEDPNKGMGLGSEPTQLTQLAVLDDLDHYIKEQLHIKHYIRYMDDFILIHHDKEYLKYCGEKIRERIQSKGLRLSLKENTVVSFQTADTFPRFQFPYNRNRKGHKDLASRKDFQ